VPLHLHRTMGWLLEIAGGLLVIAVAGVAIFIATFDVNRLIAPGQARVKAVTGRDLLIRGGGDEPAAGARLRKIGRQRALDDAAGPEARCNRRM